jgi:spore coat protein H
MRFPELHRKGKGKLLYLISFIFLFSCYKNVYVTPLLFDDGNSYFTINNIQPIYDHQKKLIIFPVHSDEISDFHPDIKFTKCQGMKINNSEILSGYPVEGIHFNTKDTFKVEIDTGSNNYVTYNLFLTTLPVFQIASENKIEDEPKTYSQVRIYDPYNQEKIAFYEAGIEIRGGVSKSYPKINYSIELWENNSGDDKISESLLGMRYDDDWIMDGMYRDYARMRNIVSFDLWKEIGRMDYLNEEPDARSNIEGKPAEIFLNGNYLGIYSISERLDEQLLKLDPIEGLLYKSESWSLSTTFNELPDTTSSYNWDGWEIKYCGVSNEPNWRPLYGLLDLIINADDEKFVKEIPDFLSLDNAIDLFIFINLTKAYDNVGKNLIIARYNNSSRFLLIPWDLDATWGRYWDTSPLDHEGMVYNKIYERLIKLNPDHFNSQLYERWIYLRQHILTEEHLISLFDGRMQQLKESGAIYRENNIWPDIDLDLDWEREYIADWLEKRLEYLDEYFENFEPED